MFTKDFMLRNDLDNLQKLEVLISWYLKIFTIDFLNYQMYKHFLLARIHRFDDSIHLFHLVLFVDI